MERLGEDEIFSIFERISNEKDKKSFGLVCKTFLKVACFHIRSLYTRSPDSLYHILIASPEMVSFRCNKALLNNHMKLMAASCPNIKNLRLHTCKEHKLEFDDIGLCEIANACIHLDHVDLSGRLHFKEIGIGSLVRSCKNLGDLNLANCINVTDKSLRMIGAATRLKRVVLRGCNMISDLGLEYLANGELKSCLETLYLDKCDRITDYGVVALSQLPNLKILHLNFLINITDISLREIGRKCLKMLELSLEGCAQITRLGLHAFSGHQTLNTLVLVSCYKFLWEDVKLTVLTCPNLLYLSLSKEIKKTIPRERAAYEERITSSHSRRMIHIFWN